MNKKEFLSRLEHRLSGLPREEREERLSFYSEMIDDRMEEGLSEEDAVAEADSFEEIAAQDEEKQPKRRKRLLRGWEIALLLIGSPLWLSLLIAALAVVLSLYATLWSVLVTLWACFGALIGGAAGGIAAGILLICQGHGAAGIAGIGAGLVCAGISIFWFYGCKWATAGILILTKKIALAIWNAVRKEAAE